jgi:dihydroorotase
MEASLLVTNGRVIDPSQGIDEVADLTIRDGKIADIGKAKTKAGWHIDAAGKIVCPGLIDMHVHLREPGNEDAETIASGCSAAVAGGFTSIACMPNTHPPVDSEAMVEFVRRQAARAGLCNVYPVGAITKGREGKELAEIGVMVRAGAVAFSDDGRGVASSTVTHRAMQYLTMFEKTMIQHCEDPDMTEGGCMNAGLTATRLGLPGIPGVAEEIMLQRDLLLVRGTQVRYHVAHVSTAGSVELVREAKKRGLPVTAEVCPHHLLLTEERVSESEYDTNYKVNPPLRTGKDVEACLAGVADGSIDCLATDHAPHSREEKELDFQNAPFGIISVEIALGLFARALLAPQRLDWPELIEKLTIAPAKVLALPKGTLAVGADADVTIIDPDLRWRVDVPTFRSRSQNCPYAGWELKGRATHTIVAGAVKYALDAHQPATPV